MKKLLSLLLIVVYGSSLVGCGPESVKKDYISIWLVGAEAQARTIVELSQPYTEKTGIRVECQAISWGNAHSKYLTSIAGDVTPDIGTMGLTWGMEFGKLGAMIDLNEEYPEDLAILSSKNFQGVVESTKLGNKVFGVPFDISEQIIYYRTDIIPTPPGTWEEMMVMLRRLKSESKGMVFDWGSMEWIGYAPFLWQAGGDFIDKDHLKITLDTPQAAQALEFFANLYKEGVPRSAVPLELGMRTGDFPIAISGNWKIISLSLGAPEIKGKWKVAPLPKGPSGKHTGFIGGKIMGIFSKSYMKKEAWDFIKFLSNPEIQQALYEASLETEDSYLPPNMDTWQNLDMDKSFRQVLEGQARNAKGPPPVLGWNASTKFINEAIQQVIFNGADAATELKKATVLMQKELDEARKER
jgi:multiple sugar transport system substrate-binding protein